MADFVIKFYIICNSVKPQTQNNLNNTYLLSKYDKFMNEQLHLNIIEKVKNFDKIGETHYLPHKAVTRDEKERTKLWVVFDASCPSRKHGPSFNDILHAGPLLTPLLFDINCAIVSDIEEVFLQISLQKKHRNYTKFILF